MAKIAKHRQIPVAAALDCTVHAALWARLPHRIKLALLVLLKKNPAGHLSAALYHAINGQKH